MSRLAAMLRGRRSIYVRLIAAVALALSAVSVAPRHALASTYTYESERLLAIAARHQGQIYGLGGNGYNSRGQQDLRVPIDCRAFVAVVWSEGGYNIRMPGNVSDLQTVADEMGYFRLSLVGYQEDLIIDTMNYTAHPGDWIIFGEWQSSKGAHAAIYAGKDGQGHGLVWSAESSSRIAPFDGTRPGVQKDRWEDFHGHFSNGKPYGLFPIEIISTDRWQSGTLGQGLPPAPIGYGTTYPGKRDFTGDGYDDMLGLANDSQGKLQLWAYPSTKFNYGTPVAMDNGPSLYQVQSIFSPGAFDGDAFPDVLAIDGWNKRLLLWPGGPSGLGAPQVVETPDVNWWMVPEDGVFSPGAAKWPATPAHTKPDILVRKSNDTGGADLWLYQDGEFGLGMGHKIGDGVDWSASAMQFVFSPGNWDRDSSGYPDVIAVSNITGTINGVSVNAGDMLWFKGGVSNGLPTLSGPTRIGNGWGSMAFIFSPGDFNSDGNPDIIAVDGTSQGIMRLYKGNGKGGFLGVTQIGNGWGGMMAIFGGSLCGGQPMDVMAVNFNGSLLCYPGSGSGGWAGGSSTIRYGGSPLDWTGTYAVVSPGDWSGDGRGDVVTLEKDASGKAHLHLYIANGNHLHDGGWIGENVKINGTLVDWSSMRVFSPGDFNRDGTPDLMAVDGSGNMWLCPGQISPYGKPDLEQPTLIGTGWLSMTSVFSPGDFDGDTNPDVMGVASDGSLLLYRGNGNSGFLGTRTVGTGWPKTSNYVLSPGDIDASGIGDIVYRSGVNGETLHLYLGDAKPGFSSFNLPVSGTYSGVILNS